MRKNLIDGRGSHMRPLFIKECLTKKTFRLHKSSNCRILFHVMCYNSKIIEKICHFFIIFQLQQAVRYNLAIRSLATGVYVKIKKNSASPLIIFTFPMFHCPRLYLQHINYQIIFCSIINLFIRIIFYAGIIVASKSMLPSKFLFRARICWKYALLINHSTNDNSDLVLLGQNGCSNRYTSSSTLSFD